jgi:hypothetical protein
MGLRTGATTIATVVAIGLSLALSAAPAAADVGVEKASRHAGRPGEEVRLTLACGFCFPPCVGPKGERHPEGFAQGTCMLGSDRPPPRSFGVYLISPRHHLRRFLGAAVPPPGGNDPGSGEPPRYLLRFEVPSLPPGEYRYAIRCGACQGDGGVGPLIVDPVSDLWRLTVL